MWEKVEERKKRGLRGGGGVGGGGRGGGVCVVSCATNFYQRCVHSPYSLCSFLPEKLDEEELPELVVVCAKPVLLVTMHLALCLQMLGMMVGMDQMDGKIWQHTQQSTASPCRAFDRQIDSSLLNQWIVMHGRSSLMESFVWLLPFLCVQRKRES